MTGPVIIRKWTGSSRTTLTVRGMTLYNGAILPLTCRGFVGVTSTPPPTLKPRVAGLVTVTDTLKGATSVNNSLLNNGINHTMIRIGWVKLQPDTTGVYATDSTSFDWTFLDGILNSANPGTLFKIGVDAGAAAPNWLKTATGTVDVFNTKDQVMATVPLWWTNTAHLAWQALQVAMAARYDSDPRILQVIASGSMSVYMEPWILGSDTASGQRMFAAGLDLPTQQASIERTYRETLAAWPTTRVEAPIHSNLQYPASTGVKNLSWAASRDWFNPLAAEFGDQFMVTDYGVGPTDSNPYGPTVATTSGTTLAAGTPVTSIPVTALSAGLSSGAKILMPIGQVATLSGSVSAGATALPVTSFTPVGAIASGVALDSQPVTAETLTNSQYQYGWMWLRGQGQGPVAYQLTVGNGTPYVAMLKASIDNCITLGGCYSECASFNQLPTTERTAYDAALKAQAGG